MPKENVKKGAAKTIKGATLLVLLLVVFYLAVNFLVGDRGYFRYRKLESEKYRLQTEIEDLKSENERLNGEIEKLKSDPAYIEKLARDQGLVKDGELVYQYEHRELNQEEEH